MSKSQKPSQKPKSDRRKWLHNVVYDFEELLGQDSSLVNIAEREAEEWRSIEHEYMPDAAREMFVESATFALAEVAPFNDMSNWMEREWKDVWHAMADHLPVDAEILVYMGGCGQVAMLMATEENPLVDVHYFETRQALKVLAMHRFIKYGVPIKLGLPDHQVDSVFTHSVLEHSDRWEYILRYLDTILKPGGLQVHLQKDGVTEGATPGDTFHSNPDAGAILLALGYEQVAPNVWKKLETVPCTEPSEEIEDVS
jgi:hypothetical protein